jgi:hypothetical protein
MSGAVFRKLMAEMRRGHMYLYFSNLLYGELKTDGKPNLPRIYAERRGSIKT